MTEPTTPNGARIYDYWLGGTHNFAVDRAVGDQAAKAVPMAIKAVRHNREVLLYLAQQLGRAGYTDIIDLATGIPTEGYIHELVPESSRIIYNDIDPETIGYAQAIIGDRPNIRYVQADLRNIDTILAAAEEFGLSRKVAVFIVGVAYFIEDDALRRVFQRLYDWAEVGSRIAVTSFDVAQTEEWKAAVSNYEQSTRQKIYPRSAEQLLALAEPWKADDIGLQPYEVYTEALVAGRTLVTSSERGQLGYGGLLRK